MNNFLRIVGGEINRRTEALDGCQAGRASREVGGAAAK
jgi:hypothetical protein